MNVPIYLELIDGTRCEVTNMFDVDGDDTDDPAMAHSVVAKHLNGTWVSQEVGPEMWTSFESN